MEPIILASSSPRRQEILKMLKIPFRVIIPNIDETLVNSINTLYTNVQIGKLGLTQEQLQSITPNFEFSLDGFNASIYKAGNSNYEFKIVGKCNLEKVHGYFSKIETEYNKIVQYNICENIKSKVAKRADSCNRCQP